MRRITDPRDDAFVPDRPRPLVHRKGVGPSHIRVALPAGTSSLTVYVSCQPAAAYTIRRTDSPDIFMSGQCGRQFQNFGDFPVAGTSADFQLVLPRGVDHWVVVLPTEDEDGR